MPPKKKRGGASNVAAAEVSVITGKKSTTRSGRVIKPKGEKLLPTLSPKPTTVAATKKPKAPPKGKGKKRGPKPKVVQVVEEEVEEVVYELTSDLTEGGDDTIEPPVVDEGIPIDNTEDLDDISHEEEGPFEVVQIIENMDTNEIKNSESEAVEISDQLENLNVTEPEVIDEIEETIPENEEITKQPIIEEIVEEEVEEPVEEIVSQEPQIEEPEQLVEYENVDYDNDSLPVEYITEEFVPAVETNEEVVIEDSLASLELKAEEDSTPSNDSVPLQQLPEDVELKSEVEKQETVELSTVEKEEEVEVSAPKFEPLDTSDILRVLESNDSSEDIKSEPIEDFETEIPKFVIREKTPEPLPVAWEKIDGLPKEEKVKTPPKKKQAKKDPKPKAPRKRASKVKEPKSPKASKKERDLEEVRRSSRIKSISSRNQHSRGKGLVKSKELRASEKEQSENAAPPPPTTTELTTTPIASPNTFNAQNDQDNNRPVKVKSRWRRSSELEMNILTPAAVVMETCGDSDKIAQVNASPVDKMAAPVKSKTKDGEVELRLKQFVHLKENLYLTDRLSCKEAKKMICDCFLTSEEMERGEFGCGEDCLNRLLMIECGGFCPVADRCTNKKFQKTQFAPVEVFRTDKKGLGLRAAANIPFGEFILEYVGEVLDPEEFDARADDYSNDKNLHYYFMALRADAIIDATRKGNISRFINHSCEPNAETQKWTVNGELRIGFFSTRMILAGEEITFDYRFQRYGKEAQKCFCEAPTCRGWLGEEPEDEDEDEDEEEEDSGETVDKEATEGKTDDSATVGVDENEDSSVPELKKTPPIKKERKKRAPRRKARKDIFDDLDVDDEIGMLLTTGLKNQAHTLKLSRLVVRAKEPVQRAKLLRILRRGELPCRRLFLDYHGLRLIHGYMTDAQQLAKTDGKYESFRLELLQTLATLPIPNKTMLQDSKVLPTVEKWSKNINKELPVLDSDSNSPRNEVEVATTSTSTSNTSSSEAPVVVVEVEQVKKDEDIKLEIKDDDVVPTEVATVIKEVIKEETAEIKMEESAGDKTPIFNEEAESSPILVEATVTEKVVEKTSADEPNYKEEIIALALKLLEEWSNLKEVFKIPKKERIEQMKEHEREANKGYIAGLGLEQEAEKKSESRYRILKRYRSLDNKMESPARKNIKLEDRNIVNFPSLGKHERRKMFALQVEQREEERRRKQREMWRQHEQHCFLLGTDPRLTAPFDPNQGYQCIYNPQIGQWQNYPIQNTGMIFNPQTMAPPTPGYPYVRPGALPQLPTLPYQEEAKKVEDYSQVKFMGPIPPPVKLPAKWKTAKDKYGRPYYYHVKVRKSQWEPPPFSKPIEEPEESSETTSSSDTSSLSSDTSSEDSDSDDDLDDTKLLQDVRRQMEKQAKLTAFSKPLPVVVQAPPLVLPKIEPKDEDEASDNSTTPPEEEKDEIVEETISAVAAAATTSASASTSAEIKSCEEELLTESTIDSRLKDLFKEDKDCKPTSAKKRRTGLVQEIIISPRTEEDRVQFREDLKRYKQNKEKLKREKELLQQGKKQVKEKRSKVTVKAKMKELVESNSEEARKIKETFRTNMATVVVSVLNAYRKPDCKEGRITNTEDFKHLARKLTHFVMLKEMKHIDKIEDLVCTENVKVKAKEYIRKYMSKFGENYQKRNDEPDF